MEHPCLHGSEELALDEAVLQDQTSAEIGGGRERDGQHEGRIPEVEGGIRKVRGSQEGTRGENGVSSPREERPAARCPSCTFYLHFIYVNIAILKS